MYSSTQRHSFHITTDAYVTTTATTITITTAAVVQLVLILSQRILLNRE